MRLLLFSFLAVGLIGCHSKPSTLSEVFAALEGDSDDLADKYVKMCPGGRRSKERMRLELKKGVQEWDAEIVGFTYCAVEVGKCDNEEPGDETITKCFEKLLPASEWSSWRERARSKGPPTY